VRLGGEMSSESHALLTDYHVFRSMRLDACLCS
jgi:hypothetical protein